MRSKIDKNDVALMMAGALVTTFIGFIIYVNVNNEISLEKYQYIEKLKNSASRSLSQLDNGGGKTTSFLFNYFPSEGEITVDQAQLNGFIDMLKKKLEDGRITQGEYNSVKEYLDKMVEAEETRKINSIKKNIKA